MEINKFENIKSVAIYLQSYIHISLFCLNCFLNYRWNSSFYLFFKVIKICVHNINPQFKTGMSRNWGQKINCVKYRTINSNVIRKALKWVMIIIILLCLTADKSKLLCVLLCQRQILPFIFACVRKLFPCFVFFFLHSVIDLLGIRGKLAFFPLSGVR